MISDSVDVGSELKLSVTITNIGDMEGIEVVQLYVADTLLILKFSRDLRHTTMFYLSWSSMRLPITLHLLASPCLQCRLELPFER